MTPEKDLPKYKWYLATEGLANQIRQAFDAREDFEKVEEYPDGKRVSRNVIWYRNKLGDDVIIEWRPDIREFLVSCHSEMEPLMRDFDGLKPYFLDLLE